jgi:hypothetical protein
MIIDIIYITSVYSFEPKDNTIIPIYFYGPKSLEVA